MTETSEPQYCHQWPDPNFRCTRQPGHVGPCALVPVEEFEAQPPGNCATCGNTWAWHDIAKPRHSFNDGSLPASATFGGQRDRRTGEPRTTAQRGSETVLSAMPWPHDPVLRQALIDKGVLTPDDLTNAEAKIRVVSAEWIKEMGDGQQQGR